MDKRIIYTRPDGGVYVVSPAPKARATILVETVARRGTGTEPPPDAADRSPRLMHDHRWVEGLPPSVEYRYETDEEFIQRIRLKDVPADAIDVAIVNASSLPSDRTFRDAWKRDGNGLVSVNMAKARQIHRQRIRRAREPLFSALDIAFMRALGLRDEARAGAVECRRQALRDAPADPAIDSAATPDELKAVWPLPALSEN